MKGLHEAMQRIAADPRGAAFFRITRVGAQDRLVARLSGGRATLTGVLAGFPTVMVATKGARSGRAHVVSLIAVRDPQKPGRLGLIASNFGQGHDPDWCRNLRRWPEAIVLEEREQRRYAASEVAGDAYERWFDLGTQVYRGYPGYRERAGRRIPIFELTPVDQG